jgi:signal peptidase I
VVQEQTESAIGSTIRELVETAIFILLVFFIFRGVVQNFRIEGQSMEPNLHDQQFIWVNKLIYFHFDANAPLRSLRGDAVPQDLVFPLQTPQRGDVVVLEPPDASPDGPAEDYIKRVIALPGETIQIREGLVYIDGEPLKEHKEDGGYLTETTDCYAGRLCEPYLVPPGHIVVLGDHRSNSRDSRTWSGEPGLPLDRVVGKAWLSYWPQDQWGFIASPTYAETP